MSSNYSHVFEVDKFALTANNITYGMTGDTLGYWLFFPATPPSKNDG
ncbi:MAG: DUF2855 family protein [Gammaproteobacteria bacterium]|nr:DUF2855 family protein [Gammaproteobacteria bacterium]